MRAERDELVKRVFPQLRQACERRGILWTHVDLRWGITDEQKAEGKVLPICLARIDDCRPFFIAMLGERYGSLPQRVPPDLIDREPWLAQCRDRSVTELEIIHAALNSPGIGGRLSFYFRDPAYVNTISPERRADFEEPDGASREKLAALKTRIRDSGALVREPYPDPKTLGEWVLKDLTAAIDQELPPEDAPDALECEIAAQDAFAAVRARFFVGRQDSLDRLTSFVRGGQAPGLAVVGEAGIGKSALLARWAAQYRQQYPRDLVITHFIDASPRSSDWAAMLRRLMAEISRWAGLDQDPPRRPEELGLAFANLLHAGASRGRVILVLDALNQLEDRDRALDLAWLPAGLPNRVRLLASTLPGRPLEELDRRGWPTLVVPPLQDAERVQLITSYLGPHGRSLCAAHMALITSASQGANPLYLRALLEELHVFGAGEELEQKIRYYLTATTVSGLYEKILQRFEEDYDQPRPGLVRDTMSLLWAARGGLSEAELLDLLGSNGQPLPQAYWSPLFCAAERSLIVRSGLICFCHEYLREAVERRYALAGLRGRGVRQAIAGYFENRTGDPRQVDELPWQLERLQEWERLASCLSEPAVLEAIFTDAREHELLRYWRGIGDRVDMAGAYEKPLESAEESDRPPRELAAHMNNAAGFLASAARFDAAERLYRRALALQERTLGGNHPATATTLNNLALLLKESGQYAEAEQLYRRAVRIDVDSSGDESLQVATSTANLAVLLEAKGDFAAAESLYRRALEIKERLLGRRHPDTATGMNDLAVLLHQQGDLTRAERLYRRALQIRENVLGPRAPETATCMNGLAVLLKAKGDFAKAEKMLRRALVILEESLGPEHPSTSAVVNSLGLLLEKTGSRDEAEVLLRRAMANQAKLLGANHPDTAAALNNLASILEAKGDLPAAREMYTRALAILDKALGPDHPSTVTARSNLESHQHGAAAVIPPQARASQGPRQGDDAAPPAISALADRLAAAQRAGDAATMENATRDLLAAYERTLGATHRATAAARSNLGLLLKEKGNYKEAEPLYRHAIESLTRSCGEDHPDTATAMFNLAFLLSETQRMEEAARICAKVAHAREKIFGAEHPDTIAALSLLGALLRKTRQVGQAAPVLRRVITLRRKANVPLDGEMATDLYNLGLVIQGDGAYAEAKALYREALEILERVFGPNDYRTQIVRDALESLSY